MNGVLRAGMALGLMGFAILWALAVAMTGLVMMAPLLLLLYALLDQISFVIVLVLMVGAVAGMVRLTAPPATGRHHDSFMGGGGPIYAMPPGTRWR